MPGKAHEESKNLSLIFAIPAQESQEPLLKRLDNSEERNCGLLWQKIPTLTSNRYNLSAATEDFQSTNHIPQLNLPSGFCVLSC